MIILFEKKIILIKKLAAYIFIGINVFELKQFTIYISDRKTTIGFCGIEILINIKANKKVN